MVKTEPNPATPQILFHHNDAKQSGKQKRKIDADDEDTTREECKKGERRREKGLRKEAEKAARKRKRQDAKNKATDRKDEDIASSKPVDEKVSSSSQERGPNGEMQRVRTKKKKRLKLTPVDDKLNGHAPISTDKQTLEEDHGTSMREGCSKRSRKRRRRD